MTVGIDITCIFGAVDCSTCERRFPLRIANGGWCLIGIPRGMWNTTPAN